MFRQGDILFVPVSSHCGYRNEPRVGNGDLVVAHGELTGHTHRIKERAAEIYSGSGYRFLVAPNGAVVEHDEHAPINLPKGNYRIVQQREWDENRARAVSD